MPRSWVALGLLLAVVLGGVPFIHRGMRRTTEFPVYTTGADRMRQGQAIYRPSDAKPFTYPPFFALPFLPWAGVPADPPRPAGAFVTWYLANVGVLIWILRLVHRTVAPPSPVKFWLLVALLSGRHLSAVFENQSHDLLVLLGIALGLDAAQRGQRVRSGVWYGLAAACKATPLLFGLPLVLQRRGRALLGMTLAVVGATLLPDVLFPCSDGRLWVVAWYQTFLSGLSPAGAASAAGAWNAHSFLNQSLSGTLHRLLTPLAEGQGGFMLDVALAAPSSGLRKGLTMLAAGSVVAVIAWVCWPRRRCAGPLVTASAVVCGMVLLSPMSSKSHFGVLLLPFALGVQAWLRDRDRVLGLLLAAGVVLGLGTVKGLIGSDLGNRFLAYGSVTWTAVVALGIVARASRGVAAAEPMARGTAEGAPREAGS